MKRLGLREHALLIGLLSWLSLAVPACSAPEAGISEPAGAAVGTAAGVIRLDAAKLDAELDEILRPGRDEQMELSVWIGGPTGDSWYARNVDVWRAAASSIKTSYLVELFDAYADALDAPLEGAADIVSDSTHPAVTHFDAEDQADLREHLGGATVREIGRMMIRGTGVSNAVYNGAANVTTAILGGPEELTGLIRARDPDFLGLASRRYMLAARDVTGDNEASAASLAAVLQRIAARAVPNAGPETIEAMWEILHVPEDAGPEGEHYFKSGSLDSDPLTRIRSGFWDGPAGITVYVVMVEQPNPGDHPRDEAGEHLAGVGVAAADAALAAARAALRAG